MDKKPETGQSPSSHSSGSHRLELEKHLLANTPVEVEAAQVAFDGARSSPPPLIPRSPALSSPDQERGDASRALGESVDKVCEALVMVFGKISQVSDQSHGQTLVLRSLMRWLIGVAAIQVLVCVIMIVLAFMSYKTGQIIEQTSAEQADVVQKLTELTQRVERVAKASEDTKRTVAAVKKTADETATVQIVADPEKPGGAMVRIVPPKDAPAPPPKTSPDAAAFPVEIPVKVDEARTPRR